jgi:outer membrane lipoprotein-sorting protein
MKKGFLVAALFAVVSMANAQEASQEAIYGVKSGIITMSMDMMGNAITTTTYFDDYGRKQANVSDFGGQKSRSIVVKGETIMVNDEAKTATRMPAMMGGGMMGGGSAVNFMKLTDEVIKANNIKELGEETIAGKPCKKYSMSVSMMGQSQTQTVWVYQGITLKSSSQSDFGAMERTTTKFEENATIPASMFEIPEGVKIQDMDMNMMMGGGF